MISGTLRGDERGDEKGDASPNHPYLNFEHLREDLRVNIYGKHCMHDLLMKIQWFTLKSPLFESIQK